MIDDISAGSEEYILMEEQNRVDWERKYGKKREEVYDLINQCLAHKDKNLIGKLLSLFEDEEMLKELGQVNDIAFVIVIMEIYNMEVNAGITHTIFQWGNKLEGVIQIIRQVKFLLWEIEFLDDENAGAGLLNYLNAMKISMPAFEHIVYISSYDKEKMVAYLSEQFSKIRG